MKKIGLVALLLMVLVMTSCIDTGLTNEVITPISVETSLTTTETTVGGNVPYYTGTTTTSATIPATTSTTFTPLVIKTKEDLLKSNSDIVYPAAIQFGNYLAGVNTNIWYQDDNTPVFGHNGGDVLTIKIYNANNYNAVFSLQYADITRPSTFQDGSTIYQPEPDAVNWVTIAHPEITLLAHQLLGIPISLNIPVGAICPPNWEFRITVTDVTNETQIYTNQQVRVLVSMAQAQANP